MFKEKQKIILNKSKSTYTFIRLLDLQGNHAQVWEGKDSNGKKIIIKYPNLKNIDETLWKDRIIRAKEEISILNKISKINKNTHIASIIDSDIIFINNYDSIPILILPFYSKKFPNSLGSIKINYDLNQALEWIFQITQALNHIHISGLIHRDLKPNNILIDGFNNIKLIDFGVCKKEVTDTNATSTMFSNKWASPEQILPIDMRKDGEWIFKLTSSIDIYALGLITYSLLTQGTETSYQIKGKDGYEKCRNRYWNKKPYRSKWIDEICKFAKLTKKDREQFYQETSKLLNNSNTKLLNEIWDLISSLLSCNPIHRPKIEGIIFQLSNIKNILEEKI